MTDEQILAADTFIGRFGKLQDLLGSKVFDSFFEELGESIEGLSIIDKLHKLEKLNIVDDSEVWKEMRKARNNIAHEYPDESDLAAQSLNKVFDLLPTLTNILNKIKERVGYSTER